MILLRKALCLIFALFAAPLLAKAPPPPPGFEWHDVKAASGDLYRVIVWTPKSPAPAGGYPIVYVVDGNAWAPLIADFIKVNETDNGGLSRVRPAIVVGIGYPIDQPFDLVRRQWDLTTPSDRHRGVMAARNGGYADFIAFVDKVVKPDIERRYPIDRARQTLAGHSLGGLFTLRTLVDHPGMFQNYVALSPSIWWNDAALLKEAEVARPDPTHAIHVYLSAGELEQHETPASHADMLKLYRDYAIANPKERSGQSVDQYVAALIAHGRSGKMVDNARDMQIVLAAKGYVTRFDAFADEDHFSVVPAALGRALPFVLKP